MYDEDKYGEIRRPEHNELPGFPRKSLVKKVRSQLWRHLRCRPHRNDEAWRMTWEWARACADRWTFPRKGSRGPRWPSETEIASQYLLLALARMRESYQLRLPVFAAESVPASIKGRFGAIGQSSHVESIEHSGSALITAGQRPDLTA